MISFKFSPETVQIETWDDVKVGDRVFLFEEEVPATIKYIHKNTCDDSVAMATIEFDWKPTTKMPHECRGEVPSGLGYYVMYPTLLRKIIE